MRRDERHHLKTNPVAEAMASVTEFLAARTRLLLTSAGVVLVGLVASGAYVMWQSSQADRAGALLAEAMAVLEAPVVTAEDLAEQAENTNSAVPLAAPEGSFSSETARLEAALPMLLEAANAYPTLPQGITARYHAASILLSLGRPDDAAAQFEQVANADDGHVYGAMATMGLAESHLAAGRYGDAIAILERQTAVTDPIVPIDAVLMRLGRAHLLAGESAAALASFNRIVEEFPISVYFSDAQQEAEAIRQGTAATSPAGA